MISASDAWAAIDKFASDHDISLQELATEAGLAPRELLADHRFSDDGQLAWPSLEVIIQLVTKAGVSLREFGVMLDALEASRSAASDSGRRASRGIPGRSL